MAPKHSLNISEIEDEEDLQERRARKTRKKQPVKLSFLDDDLEPPVMLFKKVEQVEQRWHVTPSGEINGQKDDNKCNNITGDSRDGVPTVVNTSTCPENGEEYPVVVESDQLISESSVHSIPDITKISRVLISSYEQLELHHLFSTVEENCKFRLFLYAVCFGQSSFWPRDPIITSVIKRILTMHNVSSTLALNGITIRSAKPERDDGRRFETESVVSDAVLLDFPIVKHWEPIEIPKRVTRLLP